MQQISLSKVITASSSLTLGAYSTAATTAYTSGVGYAIGSGSSLDTGRRITVWSSAADASGLRITITGRSEENDALVETIVGSTTGGAPRSTVQDFAYVDSVTFSSQNPLGAIVHIGTSSQAGTPWKTVSLWANPFNLSVGVTLSATTNSVKTNFECTLDDITQTIPTAAPKTLSSATTVVPFYPTPFIPQVAGSTVLSTAIDAFTVGNLTAAVAAWRVTLTSSSSTAGVAGITAVQAGV